MADNTQLNPGTGGDIIKTEDLGSYKIAVSKLYLGAGGVDGGPVTTSNPLPVTIGNFPPTQTVTGTVGIQNFPSIQPITGSVSVANFPATQPVSANNLPLPTGAATSAKQAAPGTAGLASSDVLTVQGIASMTALKVDGSAVTQPISGSVSVANFPTTQPVSGTVSVSGTVVSNANLVVASAAVTSANPVPVSNVAALPAGANTIGIVISQPATGVLVNGTTTLTPKFASIAASNAGDNTLVSAVSGKKLRVVKYTIVASGAVSAKFRTSSGTDLSGAMSLGANSGVGGAFCPLGLLETIAGDGLVLNLSAATPVAGHLTYVEV